jgi:hypothetical protein
LVEFKQFVIIVLFNFNFLIIAEFINYFLSFILKELIIEFYLISFNPKSLIIFNLIQLDFKHLIIKEFLVKLISFRLFIVLISLLKDFVIQLLSQ